MNREERIAKARQMAREHTPQHREQDRKLANQIHLRLSQVGASQAQRHVTAAEQSGDHEYLDPQQTPREWERAVELARLVTMARAKRRDTITYGELKWAIYDELRMLVDHSLFPTLVEAVNRESDGVLLSSIIVTQDTGKPGDGFVPHAQSLGFDRPVATLQRQVYEHFK